jgi:fructosamine-3-kinase
MIPQAVEKWLAENGFGEVRFARPVGGGCINNGTRLETESGQSFFLKTNSHAPEDMFAREAEGLDALQVGDGPKVPQPYLHGSDFLLLEDLSPAVHQAGYWGEFGRLLAALHEHTNPRFGFPHDNYIGSTPQPNQWTKDGYEFFGEQRLLFQARLASSRGFLEKSQVQQVERLAKRLPDLVPEQPASLIHGDLWSGNATSDAQGAPAIIDPAAHYGWAEAELGMTALFGSFPDAFYQAYDEARPLEPGYRQRFPLYNLYHLLNHLNLFGRGYYGQVTSVIRRYGG